jgi:hypothetical protein
MEGGGKGRGYQHLWNVGAAAGNGGLPFVDGARRSGGDGLKGGVAKNEREKVAWQSDAGDRGGGGGAGRMENVGGGKHETKGARIIACAENEAGHRNRGRDFEQERRRADGDDVAGGVVFAADFMKRGNEREGGVEADRGRMRGVGVVQGAKGKERVGVDQGERGREFGVGERHRLKHVNVRREFPRLMPMCTLRWPSTLNPQPSTLDPQS